MNNEGLEKSAISKCSFTLNAELSELSVNGVVRFQNNGNNNIQSYWNNKKLTIPVYGVYKVSWGFHQNSISTFYRNSKTELGLVINNRIYADKAKITKESANIQTVKSSHKTLTLLLRENETIALSAEIFNANSLNMTDVYLKVDKLNVA